MTPRWVLRALALHLLWRLPIAQPWDPPLPAWWSGGRVLTTPHWHVGVRPAASLGEGLGATIQVTTDVVP